MSNTTEEYRLAADASQFDDNNPKNGSTDVRVLSLKRQHFLDKYETPLECCYSCWGYYDGLDIIDAGPYGGLQGKRLSRKLTPSPVSCIWYQTEELYSRVNGRYGIQLLGIYRDKDELCKSFWKLEEKNPFFAVCFLQLKDRTQKEEFKGLFEKIDEMNDIKCGVITYYTLDNADLIILICSNSLNKLQNVIISIEENAYVDYLHSIQGVSEKYLSACDNEKKILSEWKGVKCHTEERIEQVWFKAVSADVNLVLKKIKDISIDTEQEWPLNGMDELKEAECVRVEEHESVSFVLQGVTVGKFLQYLVPNGLITHQNGLYNKGLFNIHTTVVMNKAEISDVEKMARNAEPFYRWCSQIIKDLAQKAKEIYEKKNDGFYSAILSLIHTLNTLSQYEGFYPARDVYCLLLPSFKVFYEMFCKSWNALVETEPDYYQRLYKLKKSTTVFLEHANSVIYHTIHTDQMYLMLPGYCGTPYTLPINLQIMYLWYLRKLTDLFNDQEGVGYQFFIVPVSEIDPRTEKFSFNLNEKDCLINLRLSQRSLSFPRSLLIILGHETMHYVNERIRNREIRFEKIVATMSQYAVMLYIGNLWDVVIDPSMAEHKRKILEVFFGDGTETGYQESIRSDFEYEMRRCLLEQMHSSTEPNRYYADYITVLLTETIKSVIAQAGRQKLIIQKRRLDNIESIITKESGDYRLLRYVDDIMTQMQENRLSLILGDDIEKSVRDIVSLYKEVFADLMVINTLECSYEDFVEAHNLSEGCMIEEESREYEQSIRLEIAKGYYPSLQGQQTTGNALTSGQDYADSIYIFEPMLVFLEEYVNTCRAELKSFLSKREYRSLEEIRDLYGYFNGNKTSYSMKDFSLKLDNCVRDYEEYVRSL